ncbi:MAG: Calcineurin-like phosphoesterase superfamily domain protein [Spirochaetes bacterium ADurb.Bin001]|nr:MAG: Calcineurin-like phosphoesterase superfamily domain protein [Spirochaetes bacterium ADurb.Bin001]
MKRTKRSVGKKADAILVADLHLTDKTPVSRKDDYLDAQRKKLVFLRELSTKNGECPILCAGDVFDHWKASPWLSSFAYLHLPTPLICIPGQHDLPGHNIEEYWKAALGLLDTVTFADKIGVFKGSRHPRIQTNNGLHVFGVPFGQLDEFSPEKEVEEVWRSANPGRLILLIHELVFPDKRPGNWGKEGYTATEILERYGDLFDLIVSGDNHQSFVVNKGGYLLVNPGSMMRITTDQKDFKPRCYLYYANSNTVEPVYFPIEENVHDISHIKHKNERDERIIAYIERMRGGWEVGLSFKKNLEAFFSENKTPRKVKEIIWQALETIN